jgi:dTMP kinase
VSARGKFITFEGIDGAGKSTQIAAVRAFLEERGIEVVLTREPGGTPLAEKIRGMLLHEGMGATAETLLFFAARADHIEQVIAPALQRGAWVLSDRFTDATYAYQVGGKGYPGACVEAIERIVQGDLQPDHTVLFDIEPEEAARRLASAREPDRFESEGVRFFTNVRNAYLERARRSAGRFFIVSTMQPPEGVRQELLKEVGSWL